MFKLAGPLWGQEGKKWGGSEDRIEYCLFTASLQNNCFRDFEGQNDIISKPGLAVVTQTLNLLILKVVYCIFCCIKY